MVKKKIVFINNHFQYSDGTVRALIGLVNNLNPDKFDITIKALYRCDFRLQSELHSNIKLEKCFGFYFPGFDRLVNLINPRYWYKRFITEQYDIEVAFQYGLPTRMIGVSSNNGAVHIDWMHGWGLCPKEFAKADKVVCVSKYNAERTKSEMKDSVNVTHCYNLSDDSIILRNAEEPVPEQFNFINRNRPLFVTVGRLSPEKGYVRLVHIMKKLADEGFTFTLIIVGGGPEENRIREAISECGMQQYIVLTGARTNPHNITAQADCFICSSFSEGYSTVCTESAILGIPVITTAVPGGQECIDDCECGIVTQIEDESLRDGIRKVLQNPEILVEWKTVLKRTRSKFSLATRVKELNILFDSIYQRAMEKN